MQGTQVWSLVWEDPTCHGATKPMLHNSWANALEPKVGHDWAHVPWSVCSAREAIAIKSVCTATKSSPRAPQLEKACVWQWRPTTAKKELLFLKLSGVKLRDPCASVMRVSRAGLRSQPGLPGTLGTKCQLHFECGSLFCDIWDQQPPNSKLDTWVRGVCFPVFGWRVGTNSTPFWLFCLHENTKTILRGKPLNFADIINHRCGPPRPREMGRNFPHCLWRI